MSTAPARRTGAPPSLSAAELLRECVTAQGTVRPHPRQSLRSVPEHILGELDRAARGVVVLAVDGLSWRAARAAWRAADLACLTSTFPSTSATAWMTAITGTTLDEHLVVGAVYRSPARNVLVEVIGGATVAGEPPGAETAARPPGAEPDTGRDTAGTAACRRCDTVRAGPTVFESAASLADPLVIGRELDTLTSPWAAALLRGARRGPGADPRALAAQAADPGELAEAVARDVEGALARHRNDRPLLLWVYVNLDEHVHRHGYDPGAMRAAGSLERHALSWAARGWTVVAHADHGQVPCVADPGPAEAWARVDTPGLCRLPAGGAGRVRWLYPRVGREAEVAERLAAALAGHALVVRATELPGIGLPPLGPAARERMGEVVAVATSPRFPLPVPGMTFEHGALTEDEMLVPFATWT